MTSRRASSYCAFAAPGQCDIPGAIEAATHPEYGIGIAALAAIAKSKPIAACMVMPNFRKPLGFQMPDERKRELVECATNADMPIIENGVYNELYFGNAHPSVLKAFDRNGIVLHCASLQQPVVAGDRARDRHGRQARDGLHELMEAPRIM